MVLFDIPIDIALNGLDFTGSSCFRGEKDSTKGVIGRERVSSSIIVPSFSLIQFSSKKKSMLDNSSCILSFTWDSNPCSNSKVESI